MRAQPTAGPATKGRMHRRETRPAENASYQPPPRILKDARPGSTVQTEGPGAGTPRGLVIVMAPYFRPNWKSMNVPSKSAILNRYVLFGDRVLVLTLKIHCLSVGSHRNAVSGVVESGTSFASL